MPTIVPAVVIKTASNRFEVWTACSDTTCHVMHTRFATCETESNALTIAGQLESDWVARKKP